jgi:hypothetical protein
LVEPGRRLFGLRIVDLEVAVAEVVAQDEDDAGRARRRGRTEGNLGEKD